MALSGIQIYKLLPQTNCKECGFPTCLAFAMKLAAKQVELSLCPYVEEEAKSQLSAAAEPPVRMITLKADGIEVSSGNEVVMFRHEKKFFHKPGLFVRVGDDQSLNEINTVVSAVDAYSVDYVGMDLSLDGFAVESITGDPSKFVELIGLIRSISRWPLILISRDPAVIAAGVKAIDGESPLIHAADESNWESMAQIAKQHEVALAVAARSLDGLAEITGKLRDMGLNDLVLDSMTAQLSQSLTINTQIRRLALKKNFRQLGYPIISFPGKNEQSSAESIRATHSIAKYAGFIVLDHFAPELVYPLLVLRENIYTDPQKPIQVQPGVYEINDPKPEDPLLVTTNFSITYFSVANEVESAGLPAWLLVTDAEGMSVLTAWAAGKFDAERIAKAVKEFGLADKLSHRKIVLPGHVAVLSGELEEELGGWQVSVGPREAVDLPAYMKQVL